MVLAPDVGCPVPAGTLPMFSIHEMPKSRGAVDDSMTFDLFDNGAWFVNGKKTAAGCLGATSVGAVKAALSRATWKRTGIGVPCEAIATHYTEYRVGNKPVLRRELCDANNPDTATQNALADALAIVGPLIGNAPLTAK
jgi:hypothetical protein